MKVRFSAIAMLCAALAGAAMAHGDKKHVLGTLQKIGAGSVTVKQRDGRIVEVKLTSETTYLEHKGKEDNPARFSDLTVGDIVAIHAIPKGETLEAEEIKFSAPAAGTAATTAPKP
jgi:hypothetical protein